MGHRPPLAAAADVGVEKFVNISTDKAADPTSVLGYSKRIAERLTAHFAEHAAGSYVSVRFGNVLGTRGSVLHAFQAQIEAGGPVTVTHPEVTRYFMTIHEAVQLVIQAAAVNGQRHAGESDGTDDARPAPLRHPGEALVLDMGEPILIDDFARRLISQSGRDIDVVYTGLRPGEKLHEDLFGDAEHVVRRVHPLISHVHVPPLDPRSVKDLDPQRPAAEVTAQLRDLCTSRIPLPVSQTAGTGPGRRPNRSATVRPGGHAGTSPLVPTRPAGAPPRPAGWQGPAPTAEPGPRPPGVRLATPVFGAGLKRAVDLVFAALRAGYELAGAGGGGRVGAAAPGEPRAVPPSPPGPSCPVVQAVEVPHHDR